MKKVLIIDDDPAVRNVLGRFLGTCNYAALYANDGLQGLESAKSHHPDLIILDITMPTMDGISLCSLLKKEESTKRIPVLFLTGEGRMGVAEDALQEGAAGFLTKPIDFIRLKKKIESLLGEV